MEKYSPMMQAYLDLKQKYQDAIVFYRLGDFYEMFFDDAKIASNELDLVLTGKNAGVKDRVPMCGIPHHAVNTYLQKLLQRGYKVAIVEQLEDPKLAKGIVKRDVIRVVTPGTNMDDPENEKNSVYIASVIDYQYGLALSFCEMATGEIYVKSVKKNATALLQELLKYNVRELVCSESFDQHIIMMLREHGGIMISYCEAKEIEERYLPLIDAIEEYYYRDAFGLLLNYLSVTQMRLLDHLRPAVLDNDDLHMQMDYATRVNLELVESLRQNSRSLTLWQFLDSCRTAMGSRLLKKWLEKPLIHVEDIQERQKAVTWMVNDFQLREKLKNSLTGIYDMERLIARFAFGSANAIDGLRLSRSLNALPEMMDTLKDMPAFATRSQLDLCEELRGELDNAFVENPPVSTREGGMFVDGYNADLDHYRQIQRDGKKVIAGLEAKEREKTGIKNLKVGYNRVFGYYFEVSKANIGLIKEEDGYVKKQTLVNAERFVSDELKQIEDDILHAEERSLGLESELFENLVQEVKKYLPRLQKIADMIALIDALYALSVTSSRRQYCCPVFVKDRSVRIRKGRHPILDEQMKEKRFVANDLEMQEDKRIMILTGPNMGGKSTYMRQNALIAIMAQIGCYVPAQSCELPVFDKIFTRIGASDDILGGQSTFMVEMNEANNALQNATRDSLIIFDEIGRGTSTYDGMALAQAIIEYIAKNIGALTLFSTHYHELTVLEEDLDRVVNYYVEVFEENDQVTFLYHVRKGRINKSYGINVARLARLPDKVIQRAENILKELESKKRLVQQSLLVLPEAEEKEKRSETEEKLMMADVNTLTPIQALQMVADLQDEIRKREEKWEK